MGNNSINLHKMADDAIFDLSLVKKKKTGFDINAVLAEGDNNKVADTADGNEKMDKPKDEAVPTDDIDSFPSKKKKKKQVVSFDENKEEDGEKATAGLDMDLEFDFNVTKKKKSKKNKVVDIEKLIANDENDAPPEESQKADAWVDSERDYRYDELLTRAFDILREKNPEMAAGEKKKFIMKPPLVHRVGSKKTAFTNFYYICNLLHRMPQHVLQFLLAELGTSGSIDGSNQLIIKGRFVQKQIENVLRRYIKEYVTCHTCRSSDTILQKDDRIYFLQCEQCNSRCSVAPIKSGFQAVANKQQRQAIRDKA